ncbi:insulinase family protein [bacterium]|nr:insulinase family protein [bacterium]
MVTSHMPGMHSVAIGVWMACGLRHESMRLNGISHFVEHLVFKGTKNRSDREISQSIEGVGGVLNASTGDELTFFFSQVPREKFALALEVLLDITINPVFKEDYLERQRSIVLEEIHMYEDRPSSVVQDVINEVMWGNHPLGRRILGTEENVRRISRKEIQDYHKRMYLTGNCVVSVAGAPPHEEIVAEVRKNSRNMRQGARRRFAGVKDPEKGPKILVKQKEIEQCHFCLGMRTFHRDHPDRFGLKLISTLLGENMSSRLFREVREKRGLAYSIHTDIDRYVDAGAFVVSAGVVIDRTREAVATVLRELKKLATKPVPKAEFGRAKEYVVGLIKMGMDRVMSQMLWTGEDLLLSRKVQSTEEVIRHIHAVTREDIRRIANHIFVKNRLNLAIVGPISEGKEAVKWLKF